MSPPPHVNQRIEGTLGVSDTAKGRGRIRRVVEASVARASSTTHSTEGEVSVPGMRKGSINACILLSMARQQRAQAGRIAPKVVGQFTYRRNSVNQRLRSNLNSLPHSRHWHWHWHRHPERK